MSLATFLNGRAATSLRGLAWLALSDTGRLGTSTVTDDSGGGGSVAWTFAAGIPCRIDPLAGPARELLAGRVNEKSTHLVTVPLGTVVSVEDRFAIAGRGVFVVTATRVQTSEPVTSFEVAETDETVADVGADLTFAGVDGTGPWIDGSVVSLTGGVDGTGPWVDGSVASPRAGVDGTGPWIDPVAT